MSDKPDVGVLHDGSSFGHVPVLECSMTEVAMRNFWTFATTVRRTRSLAQREGSKIRGVWLTEDLVVQRVHGWGRHSVRFLCVRARDNPHREMLRAFFHHDEALRHRSQRDDPLDGEPQTLVKLAFSPEVDAWVDGELAVLERLVGIRGIPVVEAVLCFQDVETRGLAYAFCHGETLQARCEQCRAPPPEHIYVMASWLLSVLGEAHKRGVIHRTLQPKHVVLSSASCHGVVLTGWSRAVTCEGPPRDILAWARYVADTELDLRRDVQLDPVSRSDSMAVSGDTACESLSHMEPSSTSCSESAPTLSLRQDLEEDAASLFAAPEQLVDIYFGTSACSLTTDIYHTSAVILVGLTGGVPVVAANGDCDETFEELKKLTVMAVCDRRNESRKPGVQVEAFLASLERLMSSEVSLGCVPASFQPWFAKCLRRDAAQRPQTALEAQDLLDCVWSAFSSDEVHKTSLDVEDLAKKELAQRRPRLVFERPSELDEMEVL
uniref:Protein kinase domain-containing protein n=1 Tax=Noctiluca scintillans TaxID=2966 RepID=A0A7S1EYX3_NOCSC|mmetsp:Transcript_18200/g.48877  ORF Transcript_18200/g.48877 Transcript_18200/m.48877 type:complete len:493 (+) Transcript_18200:83-1561(+)